MKLIAEYTDNDLECIVEAKDGKKTYAIEGIFASSEQKNRNGRVYPKAVMESAVGKYIDEQVSKGRAVGELNHPEGPTINLDKVSHKIESLDWKGNDVVGKATILGTPMGKIVEGLLDGGVRVGVSTRGMGSLQRSGGAMTVGPDFMLNAVDIVQDPSAPNAFVNGVMEGVEWVWNNGIIEAQTIESTKERLEYASKRLSSIEYSNAQIKEWKNFLNAVKRG